MRLAFTSNHSELYNSVIVRLIFHGLIIYRLFFKYVDGIITGWGRRRGHLYVYI